MNDSNQLTSNELYVGMILGVGPEQNPAVVLIHEEKFTQVMDLADHTYRNLGWVSSTEATQPITAISDTVRIDPLVLAQNRAMNQIKALLSQISKALPLPLGLGYRMDWEAGMVTVEFLRLDPAETESEEN